MFWLLSLPFKIASALLRFALALVAIAFSPLMLFLICAVVAAAYFL